MNIASSISGERTLLTLTGPLTIYEAGEAKSRLLGPLAQADETEMDLSRVSEIDTAGIQLLILAKREAAAAGKTLSFTGHSRPVVELLELYGLAAWFGDPLVLPPEASDPGERT